MLLFWPLWSCYYDDFISISDTVSEDVTHRTIDALLISWAGSTPQTPGRQNPSMPWGFNLCWRTCASSTEKRVSNLLESIREHLSSGKMTASQPSKSGESFSMLEASCSAVSCALVLVESPTLHTASHSQTCPMNASRLFMTFVG